eukprot:SAG25_NODE_5130_length_698_cov_62.377295_1_plen_57_part_10
MSEPLLAHAVNPLAAATATDDPRRWAPSGDAMAGASLQAPPATVAPQPGGGGGGGGG